MPIVDPQGLVALALVPFQINAHYNNALPAGRPGETRNQSIAEYLAQNPQAYVEPLPEANWLDVRGNKFSLHGLAGNVLFMAGKAPVVALSGPLVLP